MYMHSTDCCNIHYCYVQTDTVTTTLLAWENAIVLGSNNVALHFVPHRMKENVGSCGLAHVTPNNVASVCMEF